jgi:hypothetical protein
MSFDNVLMTGRGDGAYILASETFFRNCSFKGNERFGLFFTKSSISVVQCRFENNRRGAIYQFPTDAKGIAPRFLMSDSLLYGLEPNPAIEDKQTAALIDVDYCNLDIRNSPAIGGQFSQYLKLPDYEKDGPIFPDPVNGPTYKELRTIQKFSVNIDNHSRTRVPNVKDPAAVVTGRLEGTTDRQRSRALVVENKSSSESKITIDLEFEGAKSISLMRAVTELEFNSPYIPPSEGMELALLVINHHVSPSAKLCLPMDFYPLPIETKTLEVKKGNARGIRYLFQERIMALELQIDSVHGQCPASSTRPPGTNIQSDRGVSIGGKGLLLYESGMVFYVALLDPIYRFAGGDKIKFGNCNYKIKNARGCWLAIT